MSEYGPLSISFTLPVLGVIFYLIQFRVKLGAILVCFQDLLQIELGGLLIIYDGFVKL